MAETAAAVTVLSSACHAGDATALDRLAPLVGAALRRPGRYYLPDWQMGKLWLRRKLGRRKAGR
jgi:hypothetical protein